MNIIVIKINKAWYRIYGYETNPLIPFYILRYCDIAYDVTNNQIIKYRGDINNIANIASTIKMMLWLNKIPKLPVNNEKEMVSICNKLRKEYNSV